MKKGCIEFLNMVVYQIEYGKLMEAEYKKH